MIDITGFNRARRLQEEKPEPEKVSEDMTVVQLKAIASKLGIVGYGRMSKAELLKALQ